jgi:hypothetical protein
VVNQRFTIVADSVSAATPVALPTITPHTSTICHGSVIIDEMPTPAASVAIAASTVGRTPKRCIAAAANGPARP